MKGSEVIQLQPQDDELNETEPIVRIGTETVLSQFPLHRLAKKSNLEIRVSKTNARGKEITTWEVSASKKYGEPGPLAYKLDTLLVNREIDESRPNIPEVIKLGSLRDICEAIGISPEGKNTQLVKKALHQNASAYITANIDYRGNDGSERSFEFGASRYEVIFLGQKLPSGSKADAVYIILHRTFREFLSQAKTRPLDFAYLKSLPPAAQRLYELLSFQIFAALKHGNPRAKYLYSDFCQYAPLTRYDEWEKVKKQLYKIHQPHKQSGYITKIEFEETSGEDGRPDWVMWYTPGRKAKREYKEFTTKKLNAPSPPMRLALAPPVQSKKQNHAPTISDTAASLLSQLCEIGIVEKKALELVQNRRESVERELEAWAHRDKSKMKEPAAWLIRAIESGDYSLPQKVESKRVQTTAAQKQAAREAIREQFAGDYRAYLSVQLEALRAEDEQTYEAFSQEFAQFWDLACRNLGEEHRGMMMLNFFEKFAGDNPSLEIHTFWQWAELERPTEMKSE